MRIFDCIDLVERKILVTFHIHLLHAGAVGGGRGGGGGMDGSSGSS